MPEDAPHTNPHSPPQARWVSVQSAAWSTRRAQPARAELPTPDSEEPYRFQSRFRRPNVHALPPSALGAGVPGSRFEADWQCLGVALPTAPNFLALSARGNAAIGTSVRASRQSQNLRPRAMASRHLA